MATGDTLIRFNTYIDTLGLSARATADVKTAGEGLYREAMTEHTEHLDRHLDRVIADNPGSADVIRRSNDMKAVNATVRGEEGGTSQIAAGVEG